METKDIDPKKILDGIEYKNKTIMINKLKEGLPINKGKGRLIKYFDSYDKDGKLITAEEKRKIALRISVTKNYLKKHPDAKIRKVYDMEVLNYVPEGFDREIKLNDEEKKKVIEYYEGLSKKKKVHKEIKKENKEEMKNLRKEITELNNKLMEKRKKIKADAKILKEMREQYKKMNEENKKKINEILTKNI